MSCRRSLAVLSLLAGCTSVLPANASAPTHTFTPDDVTNVLRAAGLTVSPATVKVPAGLSTASTDPRLQIRDVALAGSSMLQLRLTCANGSECMPFFTLVEFGSPEVARSAKELLLASGLHNGPAPTAARSGVHIGQRVALLLRDAHMRITIPATSIDAGHVGGTVRVANLNHTQVYTGTVTDDNTVEGLLP